MRKVRVRFGSPRGWAVGLGIAAASLVGGVLIGQETLAGMDSYYRDVVPWKWRERRADPGLQLTEAAPAIYTPILWNEPALPLVAPPPDPAYDNPALLGSEESAPASSLESDDAVEDERVTGTPAPPLISEEGGENGPPVDHAAPVAAEDAFQEAEPAPPLR